jgi:hypothetical protein
VAAWRINAVAAVSKGVSAQERVWDRVWE